MAKVTIKHEIKDLGYEAYRRRIDKLMNSYTKVGFPEGQSDGEFDRVVQIAAVHEFGAPSRNIPERSFLRSAYDERKADIGRVLEMEYDRVAAGQSSAEESLARVGEWFTGVVKAKISSITDPPFAPSTLKRRQAKGDANPQLLVDTGQMRASVTHHEVINE